MTRYIVREVDPSEPSFATREEAERFAEDLRPHAKVRVVEVHSKGLREAREAVIEAAVAAAESGPSVGAWHRIMTAVRAYREACR